MYIDISGDQVRVGESLSNTTLIAHPKRVYIYPDRDSLSYDVCIFMVSNVHALAPCRSFECVVNRGDLCVNVYVR